MSIPVEAQVAEILQARREARRLEKERDGLRAQSEAIGVECRRAWDRVYSLEQQLWREA